jgi:hypothetical protein
MLDGLTFAVISETGRHVPMPSADVKRLMHDINDTRKARWATPDSRSVRDVIALVFEKLQSQPLVIAKLAVMKLARAWYGTDTGRFEFQILLVQIPYMVLIIFGLILASQQSRIVRDSALVVAVIVLYLWFMTAVALSIARYTVPAIGLLLVFAPPPLYQLYRRTLARI